MRSLYAFIVLSVLLVGVAFAQSLPNPSVPIDQGVVWTPGLWITAWQSKQDYLGDVSGSPATAGGVTNTLAAWFGVTRLIVNSNASLKALTAGSYSKVDRAGFAAPGDGGAASYTWTGSACSLNSGAGDNGSQVAPTSGTGCWVWSPPSGGVPPEVFGAKGDGVTNDTTAIQADIAAAQSLSAGQNIALFSAKTYLFTPPLSVVGPNPVVLRGQNAFTSLLKETSGQSANLLNIGYTAVTAAQTEGVTIEHIGLVGNSPTGGYAISSRHVANEHVRDVYIGNTWGGIEDEQSNTDYYDDVWGNTVGTNSQAFLWWVTPAAQTAGGRSDQLFLRNVGINSGFYGNDGFVWQGMANTLNAQNIAFLQTNHGFWVNASQNTTSQFPAFASVYNLQVEGAKAAACEIDGGRYLFFTDGYCHSEYGETGPGGVQGNADNGALVIRADAAASVTSTLGFKDMSIGLSAKQAVVMQAQGVQMNNIHLRGSSLATALAYPSMEIQGASGQGSGDYQLSGVKFCGVFGDTVQHNYGLIRDAFVGSVAIVGSNFNYCQTGEVQDNSGIFDLVASSGTDRAGFALPDSKGTFVSNAILGVSGCGTGATITGNDLDFFVLAGTGTFTACTVTLSSSNSAGNNGAGPLRANFSQPNGIQGPYYLVSASGAALVFSLVGGGNMAGGGFNVHLVQAYSAH